MMKFFGVLLSSFNYILYLCAVFRVKTVYFTHFIHKTLR